MGSIRLETQVREVGGRKVLDLTGEIDVYTSPLFKEAVNGILAEGETHLVVNLAGVTYMDSIGFGTLLSAVKRLRPQGGTVNLVACGNSIQRILRITRLNAVFASYDTLDEAIKALPAK